MSLYRCHAWTWGRIRKRTFERSCIIHNFSKMIVTLITCLG
ncbi:hypothetical protein MtrunA17_Chr8g0362091 [Medicago truncatula]|uniref:Uncharacterized protein n=1 Tax=Medicago truncatula TaxID=3880 RepID=A0A396GJA4_MEDTR|nr:hypothetical protein MtrunA17_Chr8g0362091 [Medicago truncatula]